MNIPENLLYTKEHEWVEINGQEAKIGITDFAQKHLGDIVFIELPKIGAQIAEGGMLGVVESVKSASDIYSPVAGEVLQTNTGLEDAPEGMNADPYGSWIAVLKLQGQPGDLLDAAAYEAFCQTEE
jgi:glycine cleavage system H protein